ncbi:MAG: ribosome-binding factor [Patescibacteria group bacterium]|jgi:ribosome-binding factor A|nr:ribosome-binding factor [Patescibacteria group bacterium]
MTLRQEKINNELKEVVARFLEVESNKTSLITVTHLDVSPDLKNAKIYITVLPESKEKAALDFCKRKRTDIKHEIKKRMSLRNIPFVDVEIDKGEKNRQRIHELFVQEDLGKE